MTPWFIAVFGLYLIALIYCGLRGRTAVRKKQSTFLTGGSDLRAVLGTLTFSATLFSTFTLLGMPGFFRTHGVGAWIFLGVTDVAMAFVTLWFGLRLRARLADQQYRSVSALIRSTYQSPTASVVYCAGVFVFLVPYVAIQIRGVAMFLEAVAPFSLPMWVWAVGILCMMLMYSAMGGLKAIIYSDAIQGVTLLVVTWFVAFTCVSHFGGVEEMFLAVRRVDPALLSTPGPKNLFTPQFLVASFLAIVVMPISQPQLTTRIGIMRNDTELRKMAAAVSVFAFLVILPTVAIGSYGAVMHADVPAAKFLTMTLVDEQPHFVAALAIVGLIAAAMSTADSQLFALGGEFDSFIPKGRFKTNLPVKLIVGCFAGASLYTAIASNASLVMMARTSFAGTALLAPMVLTCVTRTCRPVPLLPQLTAIALLVFVLSTLGVVPEIIGSVRLDLLLLLGLGLAAFLLRAWVARPDNTGQTI